MKVDVMDNIDRMFGLSAVPIVFVDTDRVNVEDLINCRPGQIVRMHGPVDDCIRFFPGADMQVDCCAGWIGDDE